MKKNRTLMVVFMLGIVLLLPNGLRASGAAEAVKPLVMILLDTSGSMEYEAGIGTPGVEFVVPQCDPQGANSPGIYKANKYPKSRLIAAKEVLTGTIKNYWCRYDLRNKDASLEDYNYPIPHVEACSTNNGCGHPEQKSNGLLDLRKDDFKFAFMSFDSLESDSKGAQGMYSYGGSTGLGLNLGARNEVWGSPNIPNVWSGGKWTFSDENRSVNNRGQLLAPPADDTKGAVRKSNRLIQYEINSTVGYWGTPLAPLLTDAREFLEEHPSVRIFDPISKQGDPKANCRERVVILITDGRASQGEGLGGYGSTSSALYALKSTPPTPVQVFVVGFNMESLDKSVIAELDPANGGPADGVYIVDSPSELASALSEIFNVVLAGTQSRTAVTYTNATRSTLDQQYQFNAAYAPDPNNALNQVGYLDQTVYRCSDTCADTTNGSQSCAQDIIGLHTSLNSRNNGTRQLWSSIEGSKKKLDRDLVGVASNTDSMHQLFGVPLSGNLPQVKPSGFKGDVPIPPSGDLGPASSYGTQQIYMSHLVDFLRADDWTMRHKQHLGGITHATPQIQEQAPEGLYPLDSWNEYVRTEGPGGYSPGCRPTVLFTGTHDGLIHAFRVDRLLKPSGDCAEQAVPAVDDEDQGKELWSILPQHLLKQSHSLVTTSMTLMDGQPIVSDVLLQRGDPTLSDPADEAQSWRSVLTTGYGKGGKGYIALDVTHPLDIATVDILWELDNEQRCYKGLCTSAKKGFDSDFSKLGYTVPRVAYGTAFLSGKEVAVGFLPGGDTSDEPSHPDEGRVLYVVRLDNGQKIAEFSNSRGNIKTLEGAGTKLTDPITGSPGAYPNIPGAVTTRVFVGDAGGRMWRVDLSSPNPDAWTMNVFHDPYGPGSPLPATQEEDRQPVMGAPKLALDGPYGHVAVIYGTGSMDYLSTTKTSRSLVASASEQTAINGSVSMDVNWIKYFDVNEKLTGEPEVFASGAYFTTYVENDADACDASYGRLYGVHYVNSDPKSDPIDTTVAALDADGDPVTLDKVKFISTGESIPYGVQVIERPTCLPGGGGVGSSVRGQAQLVVNVAKGAAAGDKAVPKGVDPGKVGTQSITHPVNEGAATMEAAGWGYVLF
jgi:type IV pilus assembly protein PilY1